MFLLNAYKSLQALLQSGRLDHAPNFQLFSWQSFGISPHSPCQRLPCALVSAGTFLVSSLPQLNSLHCLWAALSTPQPAFPCRLLKSSPGFRFRGMECVLTHFFHINLEHFTSNTRNVALAQFSLQQTAWHQGGHVGFWVPRAIAHSLCLLTNSSNIHKSRKLEVFNIIQHLKSYLKLRVWYFGKRIIDQLSKIGHVSGFC